MTEKKSINAKSIDKNNQTESYTAFLIIASMLVIAVFYTAFQSNIYNFDGMVYALQMKAAAEGKDPVILYSPYHMLYLPAAFAVFKAATNLGLAEDALQFLRNFNLAVGILTIFLFFIFCRNRFRLTGPAIFSAFLFAFSFSVWFMSHESETYIFTVAIIILLFIAIYDYSAKKWSAVKSLLVGLLFGLAVLGHITAGLLVFPVVYLIIKKSGKRLSAILATLSFSSITVFAGFAPVLVREITSGAKGFHAWFFQAVSYDKIYGGNVNFWEIGAGSIIRTFISTYDALITKFNYAQLDKTPFVSLRFLIAGLFIFCIIKLINVRRSLKPEILSLVKTALLWIIPLMLFYTFWGTSHFKFRILLLPAVIILITAALFREEKKERKIKYGLLPAFLILTVFSFNLFVSILPVSKDKANPDLQKAAWLRSATSPGSYIIILGLENRGYEFGKVYINHFSERNVIVLSWMINQLGPDSAKIAAVLRSISSSGKEIFILNEVFDDTAGQDIIKKRAGFADSHDFRELFQDFRPIFWKKLKDDFYLYKLIRKE